MTDKFLNKVSVSMWVLVSLLAMYILFTVLRICAYPAETLGEACLVSEAVEHLLASCAVCLGLGAAVEYLSENRS